MPFALYPSEQTKTRWIYARGFVLGLSIRLVVGLVGWIGQFGHSGDNCIQAGAFNMRVFSRPKAPIQSRRFGVGLSIANDSTKGSHHDINPVRRG